MLLPSLSQCCLGHYCHSTVKSVHRCHNTVDTTDVTLVAIATAVILVHVDSCVTAASTNPQTLCHRCGTPPVYGTDWLIARTIDTDYNYDC